MMMSELSQECAKQQQNTAYGEFIQASWAQYKRTYPNELIHKEIEEFHKQCSFTWVNLSEPEREQFQEMADRSNSQTPAPYTNVDISKSEEQEQFQEMADQANAQPPPPYENVDNTQ